MPRMPSVLPNNAITSEDVLGKDVLDRDGVNIGIVDSLYVDPDSIQILGISIDKGFLRDGLLVGIKHIDEVTEHAVFLKIRPAFRLQGAQVFDKDGERVGSVKEIALNSEQNAIQEVVVKPRRRKSFTIDKQYIDCVEENIILNVDIDELPR